MILAARIDLAETAADLIEQQATDLRMAHTAGQDHQWTADDNSTARAEHDRLLLVASQMRTMARELRDELDQMTGIIGQQYAPRRVTT